jgi:hypothetical protein
MVVTAIPAASRSWAVRRAESSAFVLVSLRGNPATLG